MCSAVANNTQNTLHSFIKGGRGKNICICLNVHARALKEHNIVFPWEGELGGWETGVGDFLCIFFL